jgi:hypothetical protein
MVIDDPESGKQFVKTPRVKVEVLRSQRLCDLAPESLGNHRARRVGPQEVLGVRS